MSYFIIYLIINSPQMGRIEGNYSGAAGILNPAYYVYMNELDGDQQGSHCMRQKWAIIFTSKGFN